MCKVSRIQDEFVQVLVGCLRCVKQWSRAKRISKLYIHEYISCQNLNERNFLFFRHFSEKLLMYTVRRCEEFFHQFISYTIISVMIIDNGKNLTTSTPL